MIICRSRAIDHLRRCDVAESNPDPGTLADEAMFAGSNPQDLLLAVERSTRLHGALERLSAVQRQLLALALFKDRFMNLPNTPACRLVRSRHIYARRWGKCEQVWTIITT